MNVSVGFTHEQFEEILQNAVEFFVPLLPDASREEDVFQAMSWFYAPWPYTDDPEQNRHELGMVNNYLFVIHHSGFIKSYNFIIPCNLMYEC